MEFYRKSWDYMEGEIMSKFRIHYTMISYRSCIVEAQNEYQVQHLFEHEMLELNDEHHGNLELGDLRSIEKVK